MGWFVTFLLKTRVFRGENVRLFAIYLKIMKKSNWLKNNQLVWMCGFFSVCGHYFHLIN